MNATVFHQAVADGDATRVKFLINIGQQARVNQVNKHGLTSLQQGCKDGKLDVVNVLLNHGANTALTGRTGSTALHYAAAGGFKEIVELMITSCADVSAKDGEGKQAKELAKTTEIAEFLANAEAEKTAKSRSNSRSAESDWGQNFKSLPAGSRNSLVSNSSSDSGVFTEDNSTTTTTTTSSSRDTKTTTTTTTVLASTRSSNGNSRPKMGVLNEGEETNELYYNNNMAKATKAPQPKLRRSMSERLSSHQRRRCLNRIGGISEELSALNLARLESQEYDNGAVETGDESRERKTATKVVNVTGSEKNIDLNNGCYVSPGGVSTYDDVLNELELKNNVRKHNSALRDREAPTITNINNKNYVSTSDLVINQQEATNSEDGQTNPARLKVCKNNNDSNFDNNDSNFDLAVNPGKSNLTSVTNQTLERSNSLRKHFGLNVCENNTDLDIDVAINQGSVGDQNLERSNSLRKHFGLKDCENNGSSTINTVLSDGLDSDVSINEGNVKDQNLERNNSLLKNFGLKVCEDNTDYGLPTDDDSDNDVTITNEADGSDYELEYSNSVRKLEGNCYANENEEILEAENTGNEDNADENNNEISASRVSTTATVVCSYATADKDEGWEDDDTMVPSGTPIMAERVRDEAPQLRPRGCDELEMYRRSQRRNMRREARRRTVDVCEISHENRRAALERNEAAHASNDCARSHTSAQLGKRTRRSSFNDYEEVYPRNQTNERLDSAEFVQGRTRRLSLNEGNCSDDQTTELLADYDSQHEQRRTRKHSFNEAQIYHDNETIELDYNPEFEQRSRTRQPSFNEEIVAPREGHYHDQNTELDFNPEAAQRRIQRPSFIEEQYYDDQTELNYNPHSVQGRVCRGPSFREQTVELDINPHFAQRRTRRPSFNEEQYQDRTTELNYDPHFPQPRTTRHSSFNQNDRQYYNEQEQVYDPIIDQFNPTLQRRNNARRSRDSNYVRTGDEYRSFNTNETNDSQGYNYATYGSYSCVTRSLSTGAATTHHEIGQYYRRLERMSEMNNLYTDYPEPCDTIPDAGPPKYGRSHSSPARNYCDYEEIHRPSCYTSNLPSYEQSLRLLSRERRPIATNIVRRPSTRQVSQV